MKDDPAGLRATTRIVLALAGASVPAAERPQLTFAHETP